ncbi:MAG: hypothetical protein KDB07_10165, partial [Planctomycetes bacterium]|nr:hypothetical protein [Planctomycetota bacterium]
RSDIENYRFKLLSRASTAASEGRAVDIHDLYKDVFVAVHQMLFEQKRVSIRWADIEHALQTCESRKALDEMISKKRGENFDDCLTLLRNLESMYGYVYVCARVAVLYYIRTLLPNEQKV